MAFFTRPDELVFGEETAVQAGARPVPAVLASALRAACDGCDPA